MITCSACGYDQNLDVSEYCDACGSELTRAIPANQAPTIIQTPISPPESTATTTTTARLITKQPHPPLAEFSLDNNVLIGLFDPDTGPVDIDLEAFSGSDTVSRNHAEIYQEGGVWKVKDIGSTNGTFIKPVGQIRFGSRITLPEILNPGDEIAFAKVRFLFQSP